MQYLLTQEELDALKGAAEVERQVKEHMTQIARALEKVLHQHDVRFGTSPYTDGLVRDLREALKTK